MTEPARELGSSGLPPVLTLEKLFSRGDYRPAMGLSPLHVSEYFRNSGWPEILAERQRLLASTPEDFVCESASEHNRRIVGKFARCWNPDLEVGSFVKLGRGWEPDFIVVDRRPPHPVLGGCVCFPSGWSLPEKLAQPVRLVHARVPALNGLLGSRIGQFLARLEVDKFYQRTNWGVTSSNQLNQHPKQQIPLIQASRSDPFLRIEWQAFGALSADLILFGIRIFHIPFQQVRQNPEAAALLARNLETMSPEMLQYKRLDGCRDQLVGFLLKGGVTTN